VRPGTQLRPEQHPTARGDASARDLPYLNDCVLMFRGEPRIHGTQYMIKDGVPELWTVSAPEGLDERRAAC
jgi:hypothetical protein